MNNRRLQIFALGATALLLAACMETTGQAERAAAPGTPAQQPAPGVYQPGDADSAAVTLRPAGTARISVLDGQPVAIAVGARDGGQDSARLEPGRHVAMVSAGDARQGLNLEFEATSGNYYAVILTYGSDNERFWTPVIVEGAPDGRIVADKDGLLVGRSPAEATRMLSSATAPDAGRAEAEARVKALFDAGRDSFGRSEFEAALRAFDEALAIAPTFDAALVFRGMTLQRLNRPKEALASLDAAIEAGQRARGERDEWLNWPYFQKGTVLLAMRRPLQANEAFGRSIALKPTPAALLARSNLNMGLGQGLGNKGDWDAAEPYFRQAQADAEAGTVLAPQNSRFWVLKSASHIMLNEHDEACASMRRLCELGECAMLRDAPQCSGSGS